MIIITKINYCVLLTFSVFLAHTAFAQPSSSASTKKTSDRIVPAEETRLNAAAFRAGLKKRGLMELLELHLKDFPPTNEIDRLLMSREIKMAEFADQYRPRKERFSAVSKANQILMQLIAQYPDDPRRFEWRYTRANSLIYDEAQPYFTNILFRGGSAIERDNLGEITVRALEEVKQLRKQLNEQYIEIDSLSIAEFERLERNGTIEQLDRLGPRAGYLNIWVLFYDALRRDPDDPARAIQLTQIINELTSQPVTLNTPHEQSRLQIQSLLLAGLSSRLLRDYDSAKKYLRRAIASADRLVDLDELSRIQWAVSLAWIERIRTDRDGNRYDAAMGNLDRFHSRLNNQADTTFGMKMVAALLERSIYQARAMYLEKQGRSQEASTYRIESWRSMIRFTQMESDHYDEINANIYNMIPPGTDPYSLDPFEQCAYISGLLVEAKNHPDQSTRYLQQIVKIAERFINHAIDRAEYLIPQVRFNLAVAQYRLGYSLIAAQLFLEVARQHPQFDHAFRATTVAVQLSARLYGNATQSNEKIRQLYYDSLDWLVTHYPESEETGSWRFYFAQLLDEMMLYDQAALQYSMVQEGRERDLESLFLRVRAMALSMQQIEQNETEKILSLKQRANDFFLVYHQFVEKITLAMSQQLDADRTIVLRNFLARSLILAAEISNLKRVNRTMQALNILEKFEEKFTDQKTLFGRVWRVRLLAYEKLDRIEDAKQAIPVYVNVDPDNAGPTLQVLYLTLSKEIETIRNRGNERSIQHKAELILLLAEKIYEWTNQHPDATHFMDDRASLVQLAEAHLLAGQNERASELFEQCHLPKNTSVLPAARIDHRIIRGYAQSKFQLHQYEQALPWFNLLAIKLPPSDTRRWSALLRDLQCRTRMNEPPADIIKVIEQQKYLYPKMGGTRNSAQMDKLLRENQRRQDDG